MMKDVEKKLREEALGDNWVQKIMEYVEAYDTDIKNEYYYYEDDVYDNMVKKLNLSGTKIS